jgi:hypothetical protein
MSRPSPGANPIIASIASIYGAGVDREIELKRQLDAERRRNRVLSAAIRRAVALLTTKEQR